MTRISKISVVGGAMAALVISTTSSWAPTAVEVTTKVPNVTVKPTAPNGGNNPIIIQGSHKSPNTVTGGNNPNGIVIQGSHKSPNTVSGGQSGGN